jgi:hypothetical protein
LSDVPPPEETPQPPAEPPEEVPPAPTEPASAAEPAAAEPAAAEPEAVAEREADAEPPPAAEREAAAEPEVAAYTPPPEPGSFGQPAEPPPPVARRRGRGGLLAFVLIVVLIVVAVLAYVGVGYAYGQGKLNSASDAYNKVVNDQNSLNDTVNGVNSKLIDLSSASTSDFQAAKPVIQDFVTKSQSAQTQIAQDDASLASADSDLNQNQWLTLINKSRFDNAHAKITHLRKSLSDAKTLTADYVQLGNFLAAFLDVGIDSGNADTKLGSNDLIGGSAALQQLKADTAKAISLDKAPGLPPEMDAFLKDTQTLATDASDLINAAASGDTATFNSDLAKVDADTKKIATYNFSTIEASITGFYKPLIDDYNSEVDKANKISV